MPGPNEPMTREEYVAALSDLDERIDQIDTSPGDMYGASDDARHTAYALAHLTEAVLTVAKGIRLLAEPPPVEVKVDERGSFTLIEREGDPD